MLMKGVPMLKLTAVTALLAAGVAAPASAQTFKMTHVFPAVNMNWTEGGAVFAKAVEELSGGEMTVTNFPAGQLGKETSTLVSSGLAEMGLVIPSYELEKLPLSTVGELPGFNEDACSASARMWHLVKEGGELDKAELEPLGLHALYAVALNPYQVVTSRKPVASLADLKGLKLRANGAAMDKAARALGAVGLQVSFSEFYDALSRGTIDGGIWPVAWTRTNGLEGAISYATEGVGLGTAVTIATISQRAWDKLDVDQQRILLEAGAKAQQHFCTHLNELEVSEKAALAESGQIETIRLSDDEISAWNELLIPVQEDWATTLDQSRRPGSEILKAYRDAPAQ